MSGWLTGGVCRKLRRGRLKPVACVGHFLDNAVPRDEMVFAESQLSGSFIWVEVDDGDARSWSKGRSEVAEVFRSFLKMMDGVADEEEIN